MSSVTPTGGPIRRLMTALSDPNIGDRDLGEVIGEVMGGIPEGSVTDAMRGGQERLNKLNKELADPSISADRRTALMSQRDDVMTGLRKQVMQIRRKQGVAAGREYAAHEAVVGKGTSGEIGEKVLKHAAEMSEDTDFTSTLKESGKSVMGSLTKKQQQLREMARGFEGGVSGLLNDKGEKGKAARKLMSGITDDMQALDTGGEALEKRAETLEKAEGPASRGDTTASTTRPETEAAEDAKDTKRDERNFSIGNLYVKTDGSGSLSLASSSRTS